MGWRENARVYRALPDGADLQALGWAAVTVLKAADDRVAWEFFAKAVQRARVLNDMAEHPVWAELGPRQGREPPTSPRSQPESGPGPTNSGPG